MWCHALTRLQCTLLFQTSCLRVDKHTRGVQRRTVTYTFVFNTHAMSCPHALAMHSAVPTQLFAFRTAQPCSAVKNCDIHILLQHSCDAMRLRACNALWRSKLAACACNSTIVQRVQEHNRAVQWRNVTYTFFFDTHVMQCAPTLAHRAVSNRLFAFWDATTERYRTSRAVALAH